MKPLKSPKESPRVINSFEITLHYSNGYPSYTEMVTAYGYDTAVHVAALNAQAKGWPNQDSIHSTSCKRH